MNPSAGLPPERLRVAHVTNEPFGLESANGVQQAVYCLAHSQSDMGQSIAVFSREDGVHILGQGADPPPNATASVRAARGKSLRERLLGRHVEPELVESVLAWRPDIVHFHSVHIPENVAFATTLARAGVRYCVTIHGALFPAALHRGHLKKTVFTVLFERRYLNEAQFIHALSPREADVIRRHGVRRPIIVAPNGIPPDAEIPASHPDLLYEKIPAIRGRRVFMFVGRLDAWQKGLDLLIEGLALARLHGTVLVLVGPDFRGSRCALQKLADRLGVSSQLVFTGPAFGQDRADLLAAAEVFVHPSRWEGLSLSVLAAAAAGKACLITREADPLGELERAQAAVFVEPSVVSIARGLVQTASLTGDEMRNLGARARRAAESYFAWPVAAHKLSEAYAAELCGTSRDR